ncbi:MAG: thiosulfate sulfurtransferase [Gammaproteobacteria bacterium]|nr:thiosulfate sulfurtransferase [Gammaproteobacteria bacterium]
MTDRVSAHQAQELLADEPVCFVDIRDAQSYTRSHITGAIHLDNVSLPDFLENTDKEERVIVYCYHGIMSQSVVAVLAEHQFEKASSLDGGFAAWFMHFPENCSGEAL